MRARVAKWGNSLGVRIPKTVAQEVELEQGTIISLSAGSTIRRASSGSRSCSNSVEPLMSANSAVTVLRSPSMFSGADALVTRTGAGPDCLSMVEERVPSAVPHFLQNFELCGFATAHDGHRSSSFVPHSAQKNASARFSVLHVAHSIAVHALNSSRGALASFRSAVEALGEPVIDFR